MTFQLDPETIQKYLSDPDTRYQTLGRLLATPAMTNLYAFYRAETSRPDSRDDSQRFADTAWATIELFGLFVAFLVTNCRQEAWNKIIRGCQVQIGETSSQALQAYAKELSNARSSQ